MVEFILHCQNAIQLREEGILDEHEAAVWMGFTLQILRMPGSAEWWNSASEVFNPEFRTEIEKELEKPGASIGDVLRFFEPEGAVSQDGMRRPAS